MRCLLLALAALAASAGAAGAVSFSQADKDRDGVVTYDEAKRVFPRLTQIQFRKNDPERRRADREERVPAAGQLLLDDLGRARLGPRARPADPGLPPRGGAAIRRAVSPQGPRQ